jgi:hypothetical protein
VTPRTRPFPLYHQAASRPRGRPRALPRTRDVLALASAALLAAGALAATRTTRTAHAASAPTTAQILAPSAATVPDALPAASQVFRCGNSYSTRPCEGAREVDVADPRTEAQRAQAADVAVRDKRLAEWLEADRHERERANRPVPASTASSKACVPTNKRACPAQAPASQRVARVPKAKAK